MKLLQAILLAALCLGVLGVDLTALYNSDVVEAEYYTRPLSSGSSSKSIRTKREWNYHVRHAGVVVTIANQERWLIHKGDDYGVIWDTVIVDADQMSSAWTRTKCGSVNGHTVNDFMVAAKIDCTYNVWTCNCQHAANGMWGLVSEEACTGSDSGWWWR